MSFPSFRDETLAPTGKHVLSAVVQYAPYALKGGWDKEAKDAFTETVIGKIAEFAPDIAERVIASELLTPADIEAAVSHHGRALAPRRAHARPVPVRTAGPVGGAHQYRDAARRPLPSAAPAHTIQAAASAVHPDVTRRAPS